MRKLLLLFVFIIPTVLFAQRRNRYKYELIGGVGVTNFLGDLGGANQIGTHAVKDWRWAETRPALTAGIRYKKGNYFAFKGALSFGMLTGNDKYTTEFFRHNRNLNFRSPVLELSTQVEFYFNKERQPGHLYRIKNAKGKSRINIQGYGFVGVGFLWFHPQGQYKGSWVSLRPLSTEGEGLPGGPKPYLPVTMSFPIGLGVKYSIDRLWSVGLEIGLHYTLSDYIDDVSGKYYDNSAIKKYKGDIAAYMADPNLANDHPAVNTGGITSPGQLRGQSKYNDAFIFGMVNINYKILYKRRTRSKF